MPGSTLRDAECSAPQFGAACPADTASRVRASICSLPAQRRLTVPPGKTILSGWYTFGFWSSAGWGYSRW